MCERISKLWADEEGLATVEYALLMLMIAVGVLTTWTAFANTASGKAGASGQ
jgi:Flp pilus assembly pilin Flp